MAISHPNSIYAVEIGTRIRAFSLSLSLFFLRASLTVHLFPSPILPFRLPSLPPFHSPTPTWRAVFQMKHLWETQRACVSTGRLMCSFTLIQEVPLQCFLDRSAERPCPLWLCSSGLCGHCLLRCWNIFRTLAIRTDREKFPSVDYSDKWTHTQQKKKLLLYLLPFYSLNSPRPLK